MLVPAVHLLIKISRFQSHFSFSALQRDGEHYSVQKTAFKKKEEEKKSTHDAIQMHTENSLFRTSENQILQGLPIWQFSVG